MIYFVIIPLLIIFFFIAWRNIRWAVFFVAALLPTYLIRFSIGPFPITVLEMLLLITILMWGFKHRDFLEMRERLKSWRLPILLFLIAGVISIVVAPDHLAAMGLFRAYLLEPILFFFVCISVLRDRRDVKKIITAFAVSALAISICAIAQRFFGIYIPAPWAKELRVTSFYPFPNAIGLFLGPLIPLFFSRTIETMVSRGGEERQDPQYGKKIFLILFWFFITFISIVAIILSQTEGAWIGVAAGLVVMGLLYRPLRMFTVVGIVAIGILFATSPGLRAVATEKISFHDWSGKVRLTQWHESYAMLRDHSFFGSGLSGYPTVFKPYHRATYIEIFQYPHNILLNFWSELGLLGVIAFGWIIAVFFRKVIAIVIPAKAGISARGGSAYGGQSLDPRVEPEDDKKIFALGLVAAVITFLIHGLVDVPYFKNDLAVQFWILMAIATIPPSFDGRGLGEGGVDKKLIL